MYISQDNSQKDEILTAIYFKHLSSEFFPKDNLKHM